MVNGYQEIRVQGIRTAGYQGNRVSEYQEDKGCNRRDIGYE
jgi:hypothetical protein